MALVSRQVHDAHLLLVGAENDPAYVDLIRKEITQQRLAQHVCLLRQRRDVSVMLQVCDIGVLSSASEGLPLALLEYGMAGLPTAATRVGQCAEVLDQGRAGILVPPAAPDELAEALVSLFRSPERRAHLGEQLRRRVQEVYSPGPVVQQICRVYDAAINSESRESQNAIHSKKPLF